MISLRMWRNLGLMGEYYAERGFEDLPQPWTASSFAMYATLPPDALPTELSDGRMLIGSAEQAFIDRMLDSQMPKGCWQAITPCFRKEPVFDALHKPYFMKLELIDYRPEDPQASLAAMIKMVQAALTTLLPFDGPAIVPEKTEIGWDLTLRGQEIGSYGIREYAGHQWVYGTGIAEPRFTTLLDD